MVLSHWCDMTLWKEDLSDSLAFTEKLLDISLQKHRRRKHLQDPYTEGIYIMIADSI